MSTGFYLNRRFRNSCGETTLSHSLFFARSLALSVCVCVCVCLYWQFKRTSSHYVDFVVSGKNEYLQLFLDEAHSSIFFLLCEKRKNSFAFSLTHTDTDTRRGIIDGAYLLCEKLYHSVYRIQHHHRKRKKHKDEDEHEHWTTQRDKNSSNSSNKTNLVIILRSRQGTDIFIIIFVF